MEIVALVVDEVQNKRRWEEKNRGSGNRQDPGSCSLHMYMVAMTRAAASTHRRLGACVALIGVGEFWDHFKLMLYRGLTE